MRACVRATVSAPPTDSSDGRRAAITQLKASKGLALADVLNSLYALLQTYGLAPAARVMLLDHLATAEYRLSTGASEKVQLSALLGAVKLAMEINKRSTAA